MANIELASRRTIVRRTSTSTSLAARGQAASAGDPGPGRPLDVVVWGATGFTGGLVAEYLAGLGEVGVRWALAGRSRDKLEARRRGLIERFGNAGDVPLMVADVDDRASLHAMVGATRALVSTVGPYMQFGLPLVLACAERGTHYADVTGEVPFMRASIDACDAMARSSGARIVHACGFDSLPSDLGVFLTAEHARRVLGHTLGEVRLYLAEARGGLSSGTLLTALHIVEAARRDPAVAALLRDGRALDPSPKESGGKLGRGPRRSSKRSGIHFDRDVGAWSAPYFMAPVNTRVVRRTHALLDRAYGERFSYSERMCHGRGVAGYGRALMVTAAATGLIAAAAFGPTRERLRRWFTASEKRGPSREVREHGFFRMRIVAETLGPDGRATCLHTRVEADKDPGYGATAIMVAECVLALAADEGDLGRTGVLTPAAAFGASIVGRLRRAGMRFEVEG